MYEFCEVMRKNLRYNYIKRETVYKTNIVISLLHNFKGSFIEQM